MTLPNALDHFDELASRLGGTQLACFLDYDGTLTPIVDQPHLAVLSREMRDTLRRLASRLPVAIVSGRDRPDVEALVGMPDLAYAGSHGFDIAGPGGLHREYEDGARFAAAIDDAARTLTDRLRPIGGVWVERKKYAAAVHFRKAARADVPRVREAVDAVVDGDSRLRLTGGKQVLELRPDVDWDKGRAVLWLLEALGLDRPEVTPIYVGDDATDEDAFRAIGDRGLGILVGEPPADTIARYALRDPVETRAFLERLTAMAAGPGG